MGASELFTGERFIPGAGDDKLGIEHYQRYLGVREMVRGKVVLDAACGEGYGSDLIASTAKQVTGLDIDGETIARARETYKERKNLRFLQGSIEEIPLGNASVDAVVSFETIEHVPEAVQHSFLNEISRILRPGGFLIMSTPNKKIYSDLYHYKNEFHIREFYKEEFLAFLGQKFQHVKLYDQAFRVVSMMDSGDEGERALPYYVSGTTGERDGKYYIAVASNMPVEAKGLASVYLGDAEEYTKMQQRILELQKEEEERNRHICELDEEIKRAGEAIRRLQGENEERNRHISHLDQTLKQVVEERDCRIGEMQRKLQEQTEEVERLNLAVEERNALLETQRGEAAELRQIIRNKEGHIELLLESERAFEREKNTHSYKVGKKLQCAGDFVLPPNSRRRFFLHVFYQLLKNPRLMVHVIKPRRIKNYMKYVKLEGIEGVRRRYAEAVKIEKSYVEPASRLELGEIIPSEETGKSIAEYEKLTLPAWIRPRVSIIIPVYNQFDYTYNCVKSIIKNSGDIAYEVIVADDCSTDVTREITKVIENIRVEVTEENVRFLLNCNNAARHARGEYLLFLNNDTQVQKDWLQPLVELIESDENIGMVGSKLVYPDGFLQEAGGILWKDGSAWNYGNRQNPEEPEFNYVRETDYISGAAIMIRGFLWKEIGGFDERFVPAYCEDSDLAFEVRRHGYKVVYQPKSVVVHFEGISNGTDLNSGQKQYQIQNSRKFYEKWKEELEKNHFENGTNILPARERSGSRKHVLVIDHYVPQYDKDAGSKTTFMYLKMLVRKGYMVTFLGDNFYPHEPYTSELQQLGIFVLYGPRYAQHWKEWLAENIDHFDVFYLNRPHISIKYIDFIKKKARGKVIFYGHDLHFLRLKREFEIDGDAKLLEESEAWRKKELYLMRKADMNYYPSNVEVEEIHRIDKSIPVKAITAYVYDRFFDIDYHAEERNGLLFVGGFAHPPNLDAVLWFIENIYPEVYRKTGASFYIVGSNAPKAITDCDVKGVIVKGFVTEEELMELYRICRMAVVPLRYGAGVKGKVVEALYYGIPLVTTSVGTEGIPGIESAVIVEDDADRMIEAICASYQDNDRLKELSGRSQKFVKEYFSEKAVWEGIKEDFGEESRK